MTWLRFWVSVAKFVVAALLVVISLKSFLKNLDELRDEYPTLVEVLVSVDVFVNEIIDDLPPFMDPTICFGGTGSVGAYHSETGARIATITFEPAAIERATVEAAALACVLEANFFGSCNPDEVLPGRADGAVTPAQSTQPTSVSPSSTMQRCMAKFDADENAATAEIFGGATVSIFARFFVVGIVGLIVIELLASVFVLIFGRRGQLAAYRVNICAKALGVSFALIGLTFWFWYLGYSERLWIDGVSAYLVPEAQISENDVNAIMSGRGPLVAITLAYVGVAVFQMLLARKQRRKYVAAQS